MNDSPTTTPGSKRFLTWTTLILLMAALARLVALQSVPPGLAQDEVLDADITFLIRGGQHAFFFREGFGHEPLYHYLAVPFQTLLGDNMLAMRLLSVVLGLLLVALTIAWARREFGSVAALVAGAGLAVSWWPIIFSRIGIRPILEPVLLLLSAWFWPRRAWAAGIFLGLSLYSYTGARVVLLIPLGNLAHWAVISRRGRATPGHLPARAAIVLLAAVLVAAPLFLTLRADPTLQQRVDQLAGPLEALQAGDPGPILESTLRTLGVATFTGDPRSTYGLPDRPLFDPITGLFFYVGLLLAIVRLRQPRYAFALIWLAVGLIPSAVTPQSPSTVRLIGALPVFYLLPGLAAGELTARLPGVRRRGLLAVALVLFLFNVVRTVRDGLLSWPQATETRFIHYQSVLLDIARDYDEAPTAGPVIADAFFDPIDHDSLRRSLGRDLPARWVQGGAEVAGAVVLPAAPDARLYVPEYAPLPPDLLAWAGVGTSPRYRSDSTPSFAVYDLPASPVLPLRDQPVPFNEGAITLLGSVLELPAPPQPLILHTGWAAKGPLPADLAIFVHVLDEAGAIVAQHDGLDVAPALLQPGDIIVQRHLMRLPDDLPPGEYRLQLGLYTRLDSTRWTYGAQASDALLLETISVGGEASP